MEPLGLLQRVPNWVTYLLCTWKSSRFVYFSFRKLLKWILLINASKSSSVSSKMTTMYKIKEHTIKPNQEEISQLVNEMKQLYRQIPQVASLQTPCRYKLQHLRSHTARKEPNSVISQTGFCSSSCTVQFILNFFHMKKECL